MSDVLAAQIAISLTLDKAKAWDELWTWFQWFDHEEREDMILDLLRQERFENVSSDMDMSDQYKAAVQRLRALIKPNPEGVAKLKETRREEVEEMKRGQDNPKEVR